MPKGRGANERRRNDRQRNPKDKSKAVEAGAQKLQALYERANRRGKK